MKYILWAATVVGAYSMGFLMGKERMDAIAMGAAVGFILSLILVFVTTRRKSNKVDAYVVKEKVEPADIHHRLR